MRPSSHQTYRGCIDNYIVPNIGAIPLEKLTSLDLQKLYKKLLTKGRIDSLEAKGQLKGLSAKTVQNILQILSSALKMAQEQRIILTNPAEVCALPKVEQREMKTLPVEQPRSFLRETREREGSDGQTVEGLLAHGGKFLPHIPLQTLKLFHIFQISLTG